MHIYTRTGDKGKTGLFGGQRVLKSSLRIHAYGTVDELCACIGAAISLLPGKNAWPENAVKLELQLTNIQKLLFQIGADLATPLESKANVARMTEAPAKQLEEWIDALDKELPPLTNFILPGGSSAGVKLHEARTVCRRAERFIVELSEKEAITPAIIVIMNRLSDYLFVAARYANKRLGAEETTVEIPRKSI